MVDMLTAWRRDGLPTPQEREAQDSPAARPGRVHCRTYWATHGCGRPRGHELPHVCINEWWEDSDLICSIMEPHWHHFGEDGEN